MISDPSRRTVAASHAIASAPPTLAIWLANISYQCFVGWVSMPPGRTTVETGSRLVRTRVATQAEPLSLALLAVLRDGRRSVIARRMESAFTLDETRRQLRDRLLKATSGARVWQGVALDEFGPVPVAEFHWMPPRDHHVVTICRGHSQYVYQERLGRRFESPSRPGEAIMIPAGYETGWRGLLPAHLRIALTPESLREAAEELGRVGVRVHADLANGFRIQDPWLVHAGEILSLELGRDSHPAQDLIIESLALAMLAHLLRFYSPGAELAERGSAVAVAAVRRAVAYIEERQDDRITLAELASAAGLSRFHFTRVFKKQVGVSPIQYLERSRIERAKALIREANLSLAHIAQVIGFSDQSHFTRRFKYHVGCTPAVFARQNARAQVPERQ